MRTLFLSHRGESDDAPENTLQAFQLAMDRDSDGIELDLRLTSDHKLICFHDADLKRITGYDLTVADSTFEQLLKYHDIPLFSDALDILLQHKHMQIELKGSPELLPFVREILDRTPERERFAISSFEQDTIAKAAEFFPDLPRLLLIDLRKEFGTFPDAASVISMLKPLQCSISFRADPAADRKFVRELSAAGLRVVCWGVNSDELGLAMAELGVNALTCNHAVALREKYYGSVK